MDLIDKRQQFVAGAVLDYVKSHHQIELRIRLSQQSRVQVAFFNPVNTKVMRCRDLLGGAVDAPEIAITQLPSDVE